MDFLGRNKLSLGQTNLKSDVNKAKATALPSQRLAAASHVQPHTQLILRAEGRQQQNKSIFRFIFPATEDQSPKCSWGRWFKHNQTMRVWDGEVRSSANLCSPCAMGMDGWHQHRGRAGFCPAFSSAWCREERY